MPDRFVKIRKAHSIMGQLGPTRSILASSLSPAPACSPCEAWRLGWMVSELTLTSVYNVASRTAWLAGAVPGADPGGAAALREWQRMWSEKVAAGLEMSLEMQRAGYDFWLGRFDPWQSGTRLLRPLSSRTLSNALRLAAGPAGAT
jgi:hypothetical protein